MNLSIEVVGLTKRYGRSLAVDNLSFVVRKGEVFAFLGPNGAGKTTTIKILTTLLEPTSGKAAVNNFDVSSEKDRVRRSFGIVFQEPSLDIELTAYENLRFHALLYALPRRLLKSRIEELLKFVELWERKDSLVKTFSGGMKRRLEIARALLHHPQILFLDEPTIGLDPQTRTHIWNYILHMNQKEKLTVFFTTHYMDETEKVADRVAIIDHGRIVAQGSAKELRKITKTSSLEDAFMALTGKAIRDQREGG